MTNPSGLRPMEFNVVVEPDAPVTKIGSILLAPPEGDRDKLAVDEGVLIAVSPHAFTYADWPEGETPPQVGERVVFAKYAGAIRKFGDREFRVLKDKDIVAVVEAPAALAAAA